MRPFIAAWLFFLALSAAAEPTLPLESCQLPITGCPGESTSAPADWEAAAQLSCERYAPYICLPFSEACNCAKRSRLTACKLRDKAPRLEAGRRTAYARTEMQGIDVKQGPWTLASAFPYCSCPAHAVFNEQGQCVCEAGAKYAADTRKCVAAPKMVDKSAQYSARPRL